MELFKWKLALIETDIACNLQEQRGKIFGWENIHFVWVKFWRLKNLGAAKT